LLFVRVGGLAGETSTRKEDKSTILLESKTHSVGPGENPNATVSLKWKARQDRKRKKFVLGLSEKGGKKSETGYWVWAGKTDKGKRKGSSLNEIKPAQKAPSKEGG